jgi:hypothetical protein
MIPENDYIKPVETLSNVGSLAPIDKHSQKRSRQEQRNSARRHSTPEEVQDESSGTQKTGGTTSGSVDYCA